MNFDFRLAPAQALLIGSIFLAVAACGSKPAEVPPAPAAAAAATTDAGAATTATEAAQPLTADATTWSPEALEDLLAPVALYPDPVLAQLLVATTNPQEVLDAGNWMVANPDIKGKPLDTAAQKAGFTLTMRSVMQFPEVVDQLCMNMPWTEELGQAYVNDQQGVMDAVQRLRAQARDVGTLKSSPQMKVSTQKAPTGDVIALEPANPNVVAVPQYNPVTVYAPPSSTVVVAPAGTTVTVPATTTTTTTTTTEDKGHSTESMVATGLLAFGAGLLVAEVFDDNDDYWHGGYYGNMWRGPMPYYPPYPYRPVYGGGNYPGNAYNRPNNYIRGGNTVIINQDNNYFNRYNSPNQGARPRQQPNSPITAARPNRPELNQLNAKAAQGPARRAPSTSEALNGKGGYAGNNAQVKNSMDRQASKGAATARQNTAGSHVQGTYAGARPGASPAAGTAAARPAAATRATAPKVQGSYAGAKPDRPKPATAAARPEPRPASPQRDAARPDAARPDAARPDMARPDAARANADRGRAPDAGAARPATAQRQDLERPAQSSRSAMSGGGGGNADRAASARGHGSMPAGGAGKARARRR